MGGATIDDIYDACERLDKAKIKNMDDYKLFLSGTKSNDGKVKKLCAQMIVRYWQDFKDMRNHAFYSLVSMLEDRDPDIRKAVIREVPRLAKTGELVDKIADVLSQMLQQTDEPHEITLLTNVLAQFLKAYPKDVLSALFLNILKSDEESVRMRLLNFIKLQISSIPANFMTSEFMLFLENNVREVLKDVTAVEFDLIFDFMRSLSYFKTLRGRAALYRIVVDQIRINEPFPVNDPQRMDQILYFLERARLLLPVPCRNTELVKFMINKGIPVIDRTEAALRIRFLRALADFASYSKSLERYDLIIFAKYFLKLIPPLPSERYVGEEFDISLGEELRLSELEPTALALALFCKADQTAVNYILDQKNDLSSWQKRVVYLARLLQQYVGSATAEMHKTGETRFPKQQMNQLQLQNDSVKIKMAENTLSIAKIFAHKTPSFDNIVTGSWKLKDRKRDQTSDSTVERKRTKPFSGYYVPPGGKFSGAHFGQFRWRAAGL